MAAASTVFSLYGIFVFFSGLAAFAVSGFNRQALTSIMVGLAVASISFLFSYATRSTVSPRTRKTFTRLGASALFLCAAIFAWRATKVFPIPEKNWLFSLFLMLFAGSLMAIRYLIFTEDGIRRPTNKKETEKDKKLKSKKKSTTTNNSNSNNKEEKSNNENENNKNSKETKKMK